MKGKKYIFIDVEVPMEKPLIDGVVYHCPNDYRIDFLCPCGCGQVVILNTLQGANPCWKIKNYNTIHPSIQRNVGCKKHFSIINGIVHP